MAGMVCRVFSKTNARWIWLISRKGIATSSAQATRMRIMKVNQTLASVLPTSYYFAPAVMCATAFCWMRSPLIATIGDAYLPISCHEPPRGGMHRYILPWRAV